MSEGRYLSYLSTSTSTHLHPTPISTPLPLHKGGHRMRHLLHLGSIRSAPAKNRRLKRKQPAQTREHVKVKEKGEQQITRLSVSV